MILGLRCWAEKFAFVLIDGEVSSCHTIKSGVKKFPADLSRPGSPGRSRSLSGIRHDAHVFFSFCSDI